MANGVVLALCLQVSLCAQTSTNRATNRYTPDPIKFTRGTEPVVLPEADARELKLDGPLYSRPSAPGAYEAPFVPPPRPSESLIFNNKKLQEFIDQRKNWIYVTPEMSLANMSEELKGNGLAKSENSDFSDMGGKPKKVVEKYMENMDRESAGPKRSNTDALSPDNYVNTGARTTDTPAALTRRPASPEGLFNGNSALSGNSVIGTPLVPASRLDGASASSPGSGSEWNRLSYQDYARQQQKASDLRFQQLLRPGSATTVSGMPSDPLHLSPDSTTQTLQPVTGRNLEDYAFGKNGKDPLNPLGDPNQVSGGGGGALGFNARVLGGSSLSPAVITPAPTPLVTAQPAILPMPKRKF